jgi:hypothetical protein
MSRTQRHWHRRALVGIVSCDDVKSMQTQTHDYRASLQASIDAAAAAGKPLAADNTPRSVQQWADLVGRTVLFENETCLVGIFAGSQFDRGRGLIGELDGWRDFLASSRGGLGPAPGLPAPVPVPASDVSLFGGIGQMGLLLAAVLALVVLGKH